MFCDLVGSTALSARLDVEDLHEMIGAYHTCVATVIERYDGFVAKYMGDGVLLYFGYPQAHEDDAERAVRASLALIPAIRQLKVPEPLQVRIGIDTGPVVVGDLVGTGEARERGIVGETPNLAARLQALGEPDAIVVGPRTRRLLGDLFELRDLGTIAVKGLAERVQAWQVLQPNTVESRFEALHAGATLIPLIGREDELDLLLRRWRLATNGEGQIVLLSGEPGIGKSRITVAVQEQLQATPHTRLRYFCSPQHQDSALHPIIGQLERAAGFEREDTAERKRDKLATLLARALPPAEDLALLSELLSLPTSDPPLDLTPQRRKEKTFDALLRQLEGLARRQPVLMIFEDLQWIDATSHELLDLTVERVTHWPVMLLVTCRQEGAPPWTGQPHVAVLTLNRFDRREGAVLVQRVVGNERLPSDLVEEIVERSDGVPLFIEELTKAVLESVAGNTERTRATTAPTTLAVPPTLHASLMARLDRLGPAAKEVAQIGAAIGREFSYESLIAVTDQTADELQAALNRLVDAGLVFRRGTPPDAAYTFKHALVQDAAYGTLLRSARQQLHARIAAALEHRFPETVDTQPELLARHFGQAGHATRAIAYYLKAGQRAIDRSATAEALAQLTKGLDLLPALPAGTARDRQELDLRVALGKALIAAKGYSAPETGQAYARAGELCQRLGDRSQLFAVLRGQYVFHNVRAELQTALQLAEQLRDLAERDQDPAHRLEAHRALGHTLLFLGEFVAARGQVHRGLALCDLPARRRDSVLYGQHSGIACLSSAAYGLWFLGYPDQALATSDEAVRWARELAHPFSLAFALYYAIQVRRFRREAYDTEALMALTNEQGFVYWSALGTINEGCRLVVQGAMAAGIARIGQGLAAHRATGAALYSSEQLGILAAAHGKNGEPDEGLSVLADALAFVDQTKEAYAAAELHRLRGELLLQRNPADEAAAEAAYRSATEIAQAQRARSWQLRATMSLAQLWRDQGKHRDAHDLLASIYGWFTEGFDTPDLKDAKALLDELG
jgi:class 3 adenylate cyclase/predicted ATPase